MKKVLIITYYWPPSGGAGVQRWLKFVKYFRDFGWEPVIYTPENPEGPVEDYTLFNDIPKNIEVIKKPIKEPYRFYKKLTGKSKDQKIQTAFLSESESKSSVLENLSVWIRGNFFIPDARKSWIKPSVSYLSSYLQKNDIDVIVTTGPPHSMHMIGYYLNKKLNIAWLADFRDPWTNIDYYDQLKLTKRADRIHHKLEKKILLNANAITVISPGMITDFKDKVDREYHFIPNGYDEEDIKAGIKTGKYEKFTLSHIGSLTKTRNPKNLWNVLREMISEDEQFSADLEIRNIGKIDFNVVESLKEVGLEKYLTTINYLPHNEVIIEQKKASLLLLLINDTPNAKLILTGKLFEYLVSGTPVLCIGPPDGDAAQITRKTNCGRVFDFKDENNLKKYIAASYKKFKEGELTVKCSDVQQYERRILTEKIASVLSGITE
ncbi:MAG: glycosyl transferase family 1 [Bacteroidetes bacterium]|nr:MAG: glycosyl transferase family 1 [Bacteroidota bacterium]